jgi:signal transduction histidine kinase
MLATSALLTALTLVACVALNWVADRMESRALDLQATSRQANSAEAVRVDLLSYSRLSELIRTSHETNRQGERVDLQAKTYRDFDDLRASAFPARRPMIDKADADVRAYFEARRRAEATGADAATVLRTATAPLETALASLGEVIVATHAQVAEAEAHIRTWNARAKWIAKIIAAFSVLGSAAVLAGMYRFVFRPLLQLAGSMREFTRGERDSRAPSSPALELATASDSFNQMADIITGQHRRMIDFIGGVAREVRRPVDIMQTTLQEFAPDKPAPGEATLRSKVALLSRELDRLDGVVDGFLDASRVEWERLDLQQGRQDLRPLVEDVVQVYRTFSSLHEFILSAPQRPVCVFADPGRLSQVLHALMSRVIECSPGGGAVIVDVVAQGDEAILTVTDHGPGMAKEDIDRIFQPFRKAPAWSGPGRGVVISLAVARRIVETHGGHMEVESEADKGSTFRVRLPLAQPASGPALPAGAGEPKTVSPAPQDSP